jgi:glycosyltransferase involved in cell wall biosynthesis
VSEPVVLSLIIATVERTDALKHLLCSIDRQQMPGLEVIVVDQNNDDRVTSVLAAAPFECIHLRSPRGLSRARNAGLAVATGVIVGFPDDDCWYPEEFLQRVNAWFAQNRNHDLLCTVLRDEEGREVAARWPVCSQELDRPSVLRAAASAAMFLRRDALRQVDGFDESIGLGADSPLQSGEDTDLALRCLEAGAHGWFEKALYACHPRREPGQVPARRAFGYGMGFGYILAKHGYSQWMLAYYVLRALAGAARAMLLLRAPDAAFYLQSARGRWEGYRLFLAQQRANGRGLASPKVLP